jgi:SMC interacting uncharacterized protein involved in chromosome segregation
MEIIKVHNLNFCIFLIKIITNSVDKLRKKKEDYTDQIREQIKIRRKEPELVDLRSNIKGLEYRLKYAKQNRELAEQMVISTL